MDVLTRFRESVKAGKRGRIREIAEGSGVSIKTLRNLLYGYTKDMRYDNVRRIEEFLDRESGQ